MGISFTQILALIKKEVLLELRQKHSLYGLILYISATIFVLYLSVDDAQNLGSKTWTALFWVLQLFFCVNAVAKSFLSESKGRMLYYYSIVGPTNFIISKIIYNVLLMAIMSLMSLLLYAIYIGYPVLQGFSFLGITLLGGASISIVFTIMSAIAAKANQNAALIAIMGFPVILPLLLLIIRLCRVAFNEVFKEGAAMELCGTILGLDALIIALVLVLFPYLWKD